jgi:hypothetical protein
MRRLTWLALRFWYYGFSKKYQAVVERRYRGFGLPEYNSLDSLTATLGVMKWRRDGYLELWDAISDPRATFAKHCLGQKAGDCDDISLFAADRIRDMRDRGVLSDVRTVGLLSVPWVDRENKISGHNVCAFSYVDREVVSNPEVGETRGLCWAHVSNWYGGVVRYVGRNGLHFETVEDVVRDVLLGKTSIGWSLADPDLNRIRQGTGSGI